MRVEELKKGEYENIEFKQDIPADKEKYLKTAVAFANCVCRLKNRNCTDSKPHLAGLRTAPLPER